MATKQKQKNYDKKECRRIVKIEISSLEKKIP